MITQIIRHLGRCIPEVSLRRLCLLLAAAMLWSGFLGSHSSVLAANVEILTPEPGTTFVARNPEVHLVLRQAGEGISKVQPDGSKVLIDPVMAMGDGDYNYLHFRVSLRPGVNKFSIVPGELHFELTYQQLQGPRDPKSLAKNAFIFHQTDELPVECQDCHALIETGTISPVGLEKQTSCSSCHQNLIDFGSWKHSPSVNQQCLSCHQMSAKPVKVGIPSDTVQEICLACHTGKKKWLSKKVIHGPVLVGGCTLCHNPHGENHRNYLWAEGSRDLCLNCHSDMQNLVSEEERLPYVHGIVLGSGCVSCHDSHASDQEFMLHKPINSLCVGCHPDFVGVTLGHPVGRHPVSGPKERRRPGRKLTCASCHDPHGSMEQYMLIKSKRKGLICRDCHER